AVLDRRFPRDSLLSHDLIEGSYARAGLLADVELVDDYPSHLSAYLRRKHRWLRGDWQIAQWIFSRVPDESGSTVVNPISSISRWKIFDNLRRSLVDPAFFLLFLAGWCFLPGGPLYWTIVPVLLLFFPAFAQFLFAAGRALATSNRGQMGEAVCGLKQASMISLLRLAFLPLETLLAFDAIVRALARRFITGERLLEWETAAQSEMRSGHPAPAERYLAATPMIAGAAGVLILLLAEHEWAVLCALPVLALWALAPPITNWLNQPPREKHRVSNADREFLRAHALRIWRYFFEFSSEHHHYLIPDNVIEDGLREASRVSPTNIGLLLNARQAAREMGFITTPELVTLSCSTLGTIAGMEKYCGHLYNWYDTTTLKPLDASPFVSSVDSGNLVASLFTLHAGALSLAAKPLLTSDLFDGLATHLRVLCSEMGHPQAVS
ncbi:MAG: glucoamylase family protein, partial [Terracidiphilus sp.]